ncbi:MAG: tetratricopeptide repeat protein [Polyangiaceae bacterium]|nr:tetratricopeptide repeat protein [Polyangiaceae bacterium]
MTTHDEAAERTPEQEIEAAKRALTMGDVQAAAAHVGLALAHDPLRPEWLSVLDAVLSAGNNDPDKIAPLGERPFFATVAVRAAACARSGDFTSALVLLIRTFGAEPRALFIRWARGFLSEPGAIDKVDVDALTAAAVLFVRGYAGDHLNEDAQAEVGEVANVLDVFGEKSAALCWVKSLLMRKARRLHDAIGAARAAERLQPTFVTALALAYALRENEDFDGARAAFESAISRDPNNQDAKTDLAIMLCDIGQWTEGLGLFGAVLQKQPDHPTARPASLFYKALENGGGEAYTDLFTLSELEGENSEARTWLRRAQAAWLHPRVEPAVNHSFIDHIAIGVDHLATHDPDLTRFGASVHQYRWGKALAEEKIDDIEEEYGIEVPADYKAFLIHVAESGAGPYYGLLPFDAPEQLQSLKGEFKHTRRYNPDTDAMNEAELAAFEGDETVAGTIALAHMGCGYFSILVIRGPRAGSVWADVRSAGLGLIPTHNTFTEWYSDWVHALAENTDVKTVVPGGRCAPQNALSNYLNSWQQSHGIEEINDTEQLKEALGEIGEGGIAVRASASRYFNEGDLVDVCQVCQYMFHSFFRMEAMNPGQIKKGIVPRCARKHASAH